MPRLFPNWVNVTYTHTHLALVAGAPFRAEQLAWARDREPASTKASYHNLHTQPNCHDTGVCVCVSTQSLGQRTSETLRIYLELCAWAQLEGQVEEGTSQEEACADGDLDTQEGGRDGGGG